MSASGSEALYLQDQWTLKRFTLSGALRYDHAPEPLRRDCIGPDRFVPVQADGKNFWCSTPADGVSYNDITPRWAVAWDLFGTGKTSIKWNMGSTCRAAGFRWQLHRQQFGAPIDEPADPDVG
jgi:hypothetical protein